MTTFDFLYDNDAAKYASNYFGYLGKILNGIDVNEIAQVLELFITAREEGRMIFFIGNGGSASTASHMANDIAIGSRLKERLIRTMSLCDNNSIITAIGNDFGYDEIFTRQLDYLAGPGDVLVAITASGNSPNLVRAFDWASENSVTKVALTSFEDGGKIRAMADFGIHVPTGVGEYGPAEDSHMILDHVFVSYLTKRLNSSKD